MIFAWIVTLFFTRFEFNELRCEKKNEDSAFLSRH